MAAIPPALSWYDLNDKLNDLELKGCLQESQDAEAYKIISLLPTNVSPGCCRFEIQEVINSSWSSDKKIPPCTPITLDYAVRLICMSQNHSFRPLNMTKSTLQSLMTEHNVSSSFIDIVSSFYQKVLNIEESLCMPLQVANAADHSEYMYVFKYPERTNRATDDPWSIRQSAFYHQIRNVDQKSTFILISPYKNTIGEQKLIQWLDKAKGNTTREESIFQANSILFDTYLDGWREYMTHYESELEELTLRLLNIGLRDVDGVSTNDITDLKFLESRLLPVEAALNAFQRLINGLDQIVQHDERFEKMSSGAKVEWSKCYGNYTNKVAAYVSNVRMLNRKCTSTAQLLDEIFNFHNQKIAQRQSSAVLFLTTKTVDDSATIRVITAITLVFLSCTAIAAIIDMPIFYLDKSKTLAVSRSIWVYVGIALALTTVTFLYWRWSLWRKRQRMNTELQTFLENQV